MRVQTTIVVLVMGVSGSGKSTVGRLLADRLGARFVDADDLHSPENVERMAAGIPLTDEDRWPWLESVRATIEDALGQHEPLVVACSALKQVYRARLARPGEPIHIVYLSGPYGVIAGRMTERADHFMPSDLLASQFETLEPPAHAIELDVRDAPDDLVEAVLRRLADP